MRLALCDERDLRAAVDEGPHEERGRGHRGWSLDDDGAVLEVRRAYSLHRLHPREVLRSRMGHEPELGRAAVQLGAQLVRGVDADDLVAEERDAIAETVGLIEVVGAQEHRAALTAEGDD